MATTNDEGRGATHATAPQTATTVATNGSRDLRRLLAQVPERPRALLREAFMCAGRASGDPERVVAEANKALKAQAKPTKTCLMPAGPLLCLAAITCDHEAALDLARWAIGGGR